MRVCDKVCSVFREEHTQGIGRFLKFELAKILTYDSRLLRKLNADQYISIINYNLNLNTFKDNVG